ncbi:fungal-specific transcription factor domain-containing protein [Leptodontidium sp. 2 PMI_412]|nr:fungal-specific transcription factor domain-containing protein [Leptodontidium sp. 2 PMI_412]
MDQLLSNLCSAGKDPKTLPRLGPLPNSQPGSMDNPTHEFATQISSRNTRACDRCRQKKIKCDLGIPNCGPCVKHNAACVSRQSRRVKRREKMSVETRTAVFESRLVRIEALLKSSSLCAELHAPSSPTEIGRGHFEGYADQDEEERSKPAAAGENFHRNVSVASHVKIQSTIASDHPTTAQWPAEEEWAGNQERLQEISSSTISDLRSAPSQPGYMELPPKEVAISLVYLYFSHLNPILPLFSQPVYMQLFDELYLPESHSHQNSAAWCSIHVVLALANCLAAMSPSGSGHERRRGAVHLQMALSLAPDILLHGSDLLSVQALLGITVVLQGTSNPRPCSILVAASARLAHIIGLHQEADKGSDLTPVDSEQRKRVFWLINILDKNISLGSKIPPLINLDDVDIPLAKDEYFDFVGGNYLNSVEGKLDIFNLRIRLSIISGSVYETLYSTKARKQSDESRTAAVQSLDEMLKEWRESIATGFSLEDLVQRLDGFPTIGLVILYSFYFHVLTTVHQRRASGKLKTENSTSAIQRFNPLQFAPHVSCVEAAREFMFLINSIPLGDYGYIWTVLYSAISAVITLLHHVLHNPQNPNGATLIDCVGPMMEILPTIYKGCEDGDSRRDLFRMVTFCVELRRRAVVAMKKYREMFPQINSQSVGLLLKGSTNRDSGVGSWQGVSEISQLQNTSIDQRANSVLQNNVGNNFGLLRE